jgi:hypothetical protein
MAIVVGQTVCRTQAKVPGACQGVGRNHGPGGFFLAVYAVGITGKRMYAGMSANSQCQGKQAFNITPTPTVAAHGDRGFPA